MIQYVIINKPYHPIQQGFGRSLLRTVRATA